MANAEPHEFLELFLQDDFWELIAVETSRYMQTINASADIQDRQRKFLKEVSVAEMKHCLAFICAWVLLIKVKFVIIAHHVIRRSWAGTAGYEFGASFTSSTTASSFRAVSPGTSACSRSAICCAWSFSGSAPIFRQEKALAWWDDHCFQGTQHPEEIQPQEAGQMRFQGFCRVRGWIGLCAAVGSLLRPRGGQWSSVWTTVIDISSGADLDSPAFCSGALRVHGQLLHLSWRSWTT